MNQNEKDISTKQHSQKTHSRISQTDEHNRWARRPQKETRQRTQTPRRRGAAQTSASLVSQDKPFSFPKSARLLARREFLFLQSHGKRRYCPHFVVVLSPAKGKHSRLGITVTRRFGNAVVRNRMKRLLREFFRTHRMHLAPAQDILIIPKAGAQTLAFTHIAEELGKVFSLAGNAS